MSSAILDIHEFERHGKLRRRYGFFKCRNCGQCWESSRVFCELRSNQAAFKQECQLCQLAFFPYQVEDLKCEYCIKFRDECECEGSEDRHQEHYRRNDITCKETRWPTLSPKGRSLKVQVMNERCHDIEEYHVRWIEAEDNCDEEQQYGREECYENGNQRGEIPEPMDENMEEEHDIEEHFCQENVDMQEPSAYEVCGDVNERYDGEEAATPADDWQEHGDHEEAPYKHDYGYDQGDVEAYDDVDYRGADIDGYADDELQEHGDDVHDNYRYGHMQNYEDAEDEYEGRWDGYHPEGEERKGPRYDERDNLDRPTQGLDAYRPEDGDIDAHPRQDPSSRSDGHYPDRQVVDDSERRHNVVWKSDPLIGAGNPNKHEEVDDFRAKYGDEDYHYQRDGFDYQGYDHEGRNIFYDNDDDDDYYDIDGL